MLLQISHTTVLVNGFPGPRINFNVALSIPARGRRLQALIKHENSVHNPLDHAEICPVLQYVDDTLIMLGSWKM